MKKLRILKNFILLIGVAAVGAEAQTFTKITSGPLVSEIGSFLGASWGDYDNDGNVDLFVANYLGANSLFHNDGNGSFTKVVTGEMAIPRQRAFSSTWGDYDNDGDVDLLVTIDGGQNLLYRNDQGTLTKIVDGAMATDGGNSVSASWGDYDNDGDLDLFVARNGEDQSNLLYQNNGNGTFTKITNGDIVNEGSNAAVGLWADYDNDGDLDLYVVNGWFWLRKNFLYRNDGKGIFTKITEGAIVTDAEGSTGGSWGDYDNDGDLDLYVTNSLNDSRNSLYRNNGNGTFAKITGGAIVNDRGASVGSSWVDYDNDGDLDLFVINSHGQKNSLYQNNESGAFTRIASEPFENDVSWSFGCGWADYDRDGDLDLFVSNGGFAFTRSNFFYKNQGNQNKWISLQCQGKVSNYSAIGATVRVKATISGKSRWQMQQITGQTGFLGQNSLEVEFGLGNATVIDSLVVNWPSGRKQVLTNVAPNQFLKIIEDATTAVADEQLPATPSRYRLADNYPNPFGGSVAFSAAATAIEFALPRTGAVKLEIYDLLGQKIRTLVDQNRAAGVHRVVWDGKNEFGKTVASGIYIYSMTTSDFKMAKRLLLIR